MELEARMTAIGKDLGYYEGGKIRISRWGSQRLTNPDPFKWDFPSPPEVHSLS